MSPALDSDAPTDRRTPPRYGRWAAIVVASLLLHLTALDLLPRWTLESSADDANDEPLQVTLMPPIRPAEIPKTETSPAAKPAPKTKQSVRRSPPPEFVPDSDEPIPQVGVQAAAPIGSVSNAVDSVAPPSSDSPAATQVPAPAPPAEAAPPPAAAIAPQSARLMYKVVSVDTKHADPVHYYGVGSIDWSIADGRYRSDLQASLQILFIKVGVLALHSEGAVTAIGIAPDRYTETPRKRATVATNFNRDARQSITFSSSQTTVPLVAGTQDRLSVLFQIGALLLADPRRADTGGRIRMPVAGIRGDVENWTFESQGVEALDTGAGPMSTTHLRRAPRPGSNDRTIDVWIAQQDGGYPAKVLYTEPNGSTTEMTLERIGSIE